MTMLAAKHRPWSGQLPDGQIVDLCASCYVPWPCDVGVVQSDLKTALARIRVLEAGLQTIENLVSAPQWDTARRYRVGKIATETLKGKGNATVNR